MSYQMKEVLSVQGTKKFAEFSSAMAGVSARQEVRDIQLSRDRGDRRAESADYLAESKSKLAQETAPIEDAMANAKNWVTGFFADQFAELLKPVNEILKKLGLVGERGQPGGGLAQWMKDIGDEKYEEERKGRPPRFGG